MNIQWDEELGEFFNSQYFKEWKKLSQGTYEFTTLENEKLIISCSQQGYTCNCHQQTFQLPNSLFRQHSPKYIEVFNSQLLKKLQSLAENQDEEQN